MKSALLLVLVLMGCTESPAVDGDVDHHLVYAHVFAFNAFEQVREVRDEEHKVTCWYAENALGSGISCLRDLPDGGGR
jgi:hypothetical protein